MKSSSAGNSSLRVPIDPVIVAASVSDRVTQAITSGIRSGSFVPGQHLPESEVTNLLGVSRASLREALGHLAASGRVTLNRFRCAFISTPDRRSALDLLESLEPLTRLAVRLAASRCDTIEKRRRIKSAAASIEASSRNQGRARHLDQWRVFYDTMIEIGGNMELARVMPLSRSDLFHARIERIQTARQRERHVAGYARIAAAVIAQDPAAADRAAQRHFADTRQMMQELPPDAFPSPRRR